MAEHWDISFSNPSCTHEDECGCVMTVKGRSPLTEKFEFVGSGTLPEQFLKVSEKVASFNFDGGTDLRKVDELTAYFLARVPENSAGRLLPVHPHFRYMEPQSVKLPDVHPDVAEAVKEADFRCLRDMTGLDFHLSFLESEVWKESKDVPSLQAMCLRKYSIYHLALGTTNGRPHVISAMDGMDSTKFADTVLTMTHPRENNFGMVRPMITEVLNLMYSKMRIDLRHKMDVPISLGNLQGMYLGSSKGFDVGPTFEINDDGGSQPIKVIPTGKKIDSFEQDLLALIDFILHGKEPAVYWSLSPKNENFFSFTKQWDDKRWEEWKNKIRAFNVPNSIYIDLERIASFPRHFRERGWVICIGHPWSRGGADQIAMRLGINALTEMMKLIEEGDFDKFDQKVAEQIAELYWSTHLIHLDPKGEDFEVYEAIVKFLMKNALVRATRCFQDVWMELTGGISSGMFNTSHKGSWTVLFYMCCWMVWVMMNAPEEDREELEELILDKVRMVIYGDDHLMNKGDSRVSHYLTENSFADFCARVFKAGIRDIKTGMTFLSTELHGYLLHMGCTFLKHQFVLNPIRDQLGQSRYLPYRETREYIVRAIWGRETRPRDPVDVLLSTIGHAWGTYASNKDAYKKLSVLYQELLRKIGSKDRAVQMIKDRLTNDDLKKVRQIGITEEELFSGFPTWAQLEAKNIYDPVFQDNSRMSSYMDFSEDPFW